MGVRLPAEYQEVEYLGSTGTQYINTGIYCKSSNVEILIDYEQGNTWIGGSERDFITNQSSRGGKFVVGLSSGRLFFAYSRFGTGSPDVNALGPTATLNKRYTIKAIYDSATGQKSITVNGETTTTNFNGNVANDAVPIHVWASRNVDGVLRAGPYGKIYSVVYKEDGQDVFNFIPCYRKADSKPGMYDLVTKQFFTNAGTGEFLVGPDVIDSISPLMVAWRRGLIASSGNVRPIRLEHGGLNNGLPSNGLTDLAYRARSIRCAAVMRGKTYTFNVQQTAGISVYFATWTYDDADGLSPVTNKGWFAAGEPFTPDRDFVKILISINGPGATNKRINLDELVTPEIRRVFN